VTGIWEELAKTCESLNKDFPFLLWRIRVEDMVADDYLWEVPLREEEEGIVYVQYPECRSRGGASYTVWGDSNLRKKAESLGFEVDIYVERGGNARYVVVFP
jgi:hypothetical protein